MAQSPTVYGLIRKRSELAGLIEHHQDQLRQLAIDLEHLDATLRLFCPDIDLSTIKAKKLPPAHAANHGQLARFILEALRDAPKGLTSVQLANAFIAERRIHAPDKAAVSLIRKRTSYCLRYQRERGVLRSEPGPGGLLVWRITAERI